MKRDGNQDGRWEMGREEMKEEERSSGRRLVAPKLPTTPMIASNRSRWSLGEDWRRERRGVEREEMIINFRSEERERRELAKLCKRDRSPNPSSTLPHTSWMEDWRGREWGRAAMRREGGEVSSSRICSI